MALLETATALRSEAGRRGLICSLGRNCTVVAPSRIPLRPGDRVKTNVATPPCSPASIGPESCPLSGTDHEAMRDLIRQRSVVRQVVTRARQHFQ